MEELQLSTYHLILDDNDLAQGIEMYKDNVINKIIKLHMKCIIGVEIMKILI